MLALAPWLMGFLLVLFRCTALFVAAPMFGTRIIPVRIRMAVSLAVSFAVYAGAGFPSFAAWESPRALLGAVTSEVILGLAVGMCAFFAISAAYAAGHLAALSMGLGFGAVLDPVAGADSTSVSQLMGFVALGALVAAGGHRETVLWLSRSLINMPPGSLVDARTLSMTVVNAGVGAMALAIRLAYPVLAAVLLAQVVMGLMGRMSPQLNIASVGFSITILAGGGILYMTTPMIAEVAARSAIAALSGGT